jgi:hypothetical protein
MLFNSSNGFFAEISRISSLFTVRFFNIVQKYANDSRFSAWLTRDIASKTRSRRRSSWREHRSIDSSVLTEKFSVGEEMIVVFRQTEIGSDANNIAQIIGAAHLKLIERCVVARPYVQPNRPALTDRLSRTT